MSLYATQAWVTSQNYLSSVVMSTCLPLTGGKLQIQDNNTLLKSYFTANAVATSYSQDYISITTPNEQYSGSIAGGYNRWLAGTSLQILLMLEQELLI